MKKVVITGASGFVGTALCKELADRGIEVFAVVRSTSNIHHLESIENVKIVYCELEDILQLPNKITDCNIDAFFHFAWTGTAGALRGNYDVQINNLRYACDAVEASSNLKCKKFIFASSVMEYELVASMECEKLPSINTLYNSAKLAANYMLRALTAHYGIEYIRAVISNIYGPGEKSPRLINSSIRKLCNGEHCSFSAGEQMYDFIYITDAVKAIAAIAEKGINNRTYYIGSTNPRPLKEFLIEMKNQIDPELEIGLGELPFDGISLSYNEFDIHAVETDTAFVPTIPFCVGIKKTLEWIKEIE